MDTHGILPGDIRDLDDLRKFPYTTKDEIIAHNKELFAVSMKQIQRLQSSSGTIGNYYVAGYTKTDCLKVHMVNGIITRLMIP